MPTRGIGKRRPQWCGNKSNQRCYARQDTDLYTAKSQTLKVKHDKRRHKSCRRKKDEIEAKRPKFLQDTTLSTGACGDHKRAKNMEVRLGMAAPHLLWSSHYTSAYRNVALNPF
jgi:uncharacterized membrane-anchored protein